MFDDEGQRIDRFARLLKKSRVIEVGQRRLGQMLMPAELGFDVGEHEDGSCFQSSSGIIRLVNLVHFGPQRGIVGRSLRRGNGHGLKRFDTRLGGRFVPE